MVLASPACCGTRWTCCIGGVITREPSVTWLWVDMFGTPFVMVLASPALVGTLLVTVALCSGTSRAEGAPMTAVDEALSTGTPVALVTGAAVALPTVDG